MNSVLTKTSSVHGTGLFAAKPVVAGEKLCEYRGERITKAESRRRSGNDAPGKPVYRVAFDDAWDLDGDIPDNPAKFANHGCEANAELVREDDRLWLVARREIFSGQEILFDYGFGLAESLGHRCRCGSSKCSGRIVAEPLRPLLKKNLRRSLVR